MMNVINRPSVVAAALTMSNAAGLSASISLVISWPKAPCSDSPAINNPVNIRFTVNSP